MKKNILYLAVVFVVLLVSCISSKKKTPETVTTIYTTEVNLEQPTAKDTLKTAEITPKPMPSPSAINTTPVAIDTDPVDGGGEVPKQTKTPISEAEKEKIKLMMRERIKAKQKKG